jgi:hypothetical protein
LLPITAIPRLSLPLPASHPHMKRRHFITLLGDPAGSSACPIRTPRSVSASPARDMSSARSTAFERPGDYYNSPEDITQDSGLSPDEKRQALNTWEQDARQMMTASNEGVWRAMTKGWTNATHIGWGRWCARRTRWALNRSTNRHSNRCNFKAAMGPAYDRRGASYRQRHG